MPTMPEIYEAVLREFRVDWRKFNRRSCDPEIVLARRVFVLVCYDRLKIKMADIADFMGHRDPATAYEMVRRARRSEFVQDVSHSIAARFTSRKNLVQSWSRSS